MPRPAGGTAIDRVLVVVPTYSERENVGPLIRELLALQPPLDVWVADDGSPDGTGAVVREAERAHPGRVRLVERAEKNGRGGAVIAAFRRALEDPKGYDVIFEMDADFSHHPSEIPKFLARLEDCDVVIGSRYIPGGGTSQWGWARALLSGLANRYVELVTRVPLSDFTGGYRAYRRPVLEAVEFDRIKIRGYAVHGEMAYQAWVHGFRIGEVPIHFRNRERESSKLSLEEVVTAFVNFSLLRIRYGRRPRTRHGGEAGGGRYDAGRDPGDGAG
jgi:dolichol-phosphate mannosyltransferase